MKFFNTSLKERIGYDFYCDIAEKIVQARKKKGWTQSDLAKKANIALSRVSAMENVQFRFRLPDIETLAKVLGVSVDWLIDAQLDCHGQECVYLVYPEKHHDIKLFQKATSGRMAFLKTHEWLKEKGVCFLEPRDRAIVELIGVPVSDAELKAKFSTCKPDEDDPLEPEQDVEHEKM